MRPNPTDPLRSNDWDQPIHADESLTLRDIVGAVAAGIDLDDAVAADVCWTKEYGTSPSSTVTRSPP